MSKLLIRPKPFEDESFSGYITRLFEINHYDSMSTFLNKISIQDKRNRLCLYNLKEDQLNKIADFLNLDIHLLINSISPILNPPLSIIDLIQLKFVIPKNKIKVCPKCLHENGYHKKIWGISLVTICPIHNCLLIDTCFKCKKILSVYSKKLLFCNCGFNLTNSPIEEVSSDQTSMTRLIYHASGYEIELDNDLSNSPLYYMKFSSMISYILYLTTFFLCKQNNKYRVINSSRIDNRIVHQNILMVANLFSKWPESYYEFLSGFHSSKEATDKGIVKKFGYFYKGMIYDTKYKILIDELNIYLSKNWSGQLYKCKIRDQIKVEFITCSQARRLIGCHIGTLRRLIEERKIICKIENDGSEQFVSRESVESFIENSKDSMSLIQTEDYLKIHRVIVKKLVEEGILETLRRPNRTRVREYKILLKSIESLLDTFKRIALKNSENMELITLKEASMIANLYGSKISAIDIIKNVICGKIEVGFCSTNVSEGLRSYGYSKASIKSLYSNDYLLTTDVALAKNVQIHSIKYWIEEAILPAEKCDLTIYRITKDNFKKFNDMFLTYDEVIKELSVAGYRLNGENTKECLNILLSLNIIPVVGASRRTYLFNVSDIKRY
ncbi:hypothetical protein M2444_006169 [Paenibacillus sp. PastF-3]|uniref:TniQ family protein n=1 Tax=Paenibacillus sp. PastF-3 TaxID=2940626 RepID=UPI00247615BD|nr:TniQ family protein [Paenibacillus sp. PastF-3]MDH6374319.1 hypothetical protein [Paenibacillus sp. PastF-3]